MSDEAGRPRRLVVLDAVLFTAVVLVSFVILFLPSPPSPPLFPYADKVIHACLFAALAWSGWRAWRREVPVAAGLVAYAVGSEVIQATLLATRSGSWADALADVVGATLGLLVARGWAVRAARTGPEG